MTNFYNIIRIYLDFNQFLREMLRNANLEYTINMFQIGS